MGHHHPASSCTHVRPRLPQVPPCPPSRAAMFWRCKHPGCTLGKFNKGQSAPKRMGRPLCSLCHEPKCDVHCKCQEPGCEVHPNTPSPKLRFLSASTLLCRTKSNKLRRERGNEREVLDYDPPTPARAGPSTWTLISEAIRSEAVDLIRLRLPSAISHLVPLSDV